MALTLEGQKLVAGGAVLAARGKVSQAQGFIACYSSQNNEFAPFALAEWQTKLAQAQADLAQAEAVLASL